LNIGRGFEWWYKETMLFDFLKGNHFWVSTATMPELWGVKGSAHSRGITWELGQDLAVCVLYLYGTWPEELVGSRSQNLCGGGSFRLLECLRPVRDRRRWRNRLSVGGRS
jgi:hypothetical protein